MVLSIRKPTPASVGDKAELGRHLVDHYEALRRVSGDLDTAAELVAEVDFRTSRAVTDVPALRTLGAGLVNGSLVWHRGKRCHYVYDAEATGVDDGNLKIATAAGGFFLRSLAPQLIASATFSAVTTYTSPTWAAGLYKAVEIDLYVDTTDITTPPNMTLAGGATATGYAHEIIVANGTTVSRTNDGSNAHWGLGIVTVGEVRAHLQIASGKRKAIHAQAFCDDNGSTFTISGSNSDTAVAHDVTGLILHFASSSSGRIEMKGLPA